VGDDAGEMRMMAAIWPWCVYLGVCVCFLVCGESTKNNMDEEQNCEYAAPG
jgi:hypothetical protein